MRACMYSRSFGPAKHCKTPASTPVMRGRLWHSGPSPYRADLGAAGGAAVLPTGYAGSGRSRLTSWRLGRPSNRGRTSGR
jgi:hypothetical protein